MCVSVPMSYGQAQYLIRCLLHSRAKSTPASRSRSSWESPLHTSSVLVSSAKAWDSPSKPRTPFQQNLLVQTTSKTTYAKTVHRPGHFRGDCQVDQMKPVGHYNGNVKTRNPYPRVWSATMDYEVCSGLEGRSMRSIFTKEGVQMWPTQGSITVHTTFLTHPTRCQLQSTLYVLLVPFQTKQHSSEPTTDSSRSSPWKWIVIRIDGHELLVTKTCFHPLSLQLHWLDLWSSSPLSHSSSLWVVFLVSVHASHPPWQPFPRPSFFFKFS